MDDALRRTSETSRAIVDAWYRRLDRLGRRRNDRIRKRVGVHWIAFRSDAQGRVFAEIRPRRDHVEVFILPPPNRLSDPLGLVRRAPSTQGWGWFRSRFDVVGKGQIVPAYRLLRQSYEDGRLPSRASDRRRAQSV